MLHDVGLDVLHVLRRHRALGQPRRQAPGDAAGAQAEVVARAEIEDTAAGPCLVERIVVQRKSGRIVVGVDEKSGRWVDHLRHLIERQDLERHRLCRLRVGDRQPVVIGDPAVANEGRWRFDQRSVLKVRAQRQLGAGEIGDVALDIGIGPVL